MSIRLSFGLSRQLWVVEAGVFLSMLGYGAVFPFEIIYLHEARGFGLGVAGLIAGLVTGVAVFVAPVAGAVVDRCGARATAVGAGVALAGGYGSLAFATSPGVAVAAAALAATYLLYTAILATVVREEVRPEPIAGGYRRVLRDRPLLRLASINVAMIAVGWGVLAWLVPPYARAIGIGPSLIGLLLLANAATVVFAQLPIVKAAEGRSRVGALSLGAATWVVACLLAMLAQTAGPGIAFACLAAAAVAFGVGECLHATSFMPLIADLAPLELRGRYMATVGLSWWLGLAVAPTLGAQLLTVSASLALTAGASLAALAILLLRAFEPALPTTVRAIPRPGGPPTPAACRTAGRR